MSLSTIMYVKPKYGEKAKLCYMDTSSSIEYIKNTIFTKMLKLDMVMN